MKKVFFVLLASVAISFTACTSGEHKTETMDSTQVNEAVNEALDSVKADMGQVVDSANKAMEAVVDSAKK
ncbi:MAG TPA: hypothetical protein PLD84_07295 [Chitinophagales bacterium]|nr:hypothetical protein [Chitinophagales bacterium]